MAKKTQPASLEGMERQFFCNCCNAQKPSTAYCEQCGCPEFRVVYVPATDAKKVEVAVPTMASKTPLKMGFF
jgi:hypothetical protein